jgi:hypothetical protein
MILKIEKIDTKLDILHNIPKTFFQNLEATTSFGDHLFPAWTNTVFKATDLKLKFEAVYKKYKSLKIKSERDKIIEAFNTSNEIEKLCCNDSSVPMITLEDLSTSIQAEINTLFLYLYNTALKYPKFEEHIDDSVKNTVDQFIRKNKLNVCPFCGLESYNNLDGQSRLPLDHWLYKGAFPMASVNFKNLIPIGKDCNDTGVKGDKNVLVEDKKTKKRIVAFYPYIDYQEAKTHFHYVNEPGGNEILDADWEISIACPKNEESDILKSWMSTMNIQKRYSSYFKKNVLEMWEEEYKEFVKDPDSRLSHANTVEELKVNFQTWRSNFKLKGRPGAVIYRAFIDYLITHASDSYLSGLCENLKR